jgi:anti-anti-sigma regulatory factor
MAHVPGVARPLTLAVRTLGDTLEVELPSTLVLANRRGLIDRVAASLSPGVRRVRLDASSLREFDSAGLGALARVFRLTLDATRAHPQLVNPSPELRESLRAVLLLRHFTLCH